MAETTRPITQYGWGQYGRRGYLRPERTTISTLIEAAGNEITISTLTGAVLGKIRTDVQNSTLVDATWTNDEKGCADFTIRLTELPTVPILPGTVITINVDSRTEAFYKGLVTQIDEPGKSQGVYKIRGQGIRSQLKGIAAETVLSAPEDAGVLVRSLIENYIVPQSIITYDASKVLLTTGTSIASDIDLSKDSIDKVLDRLATLSNCRWFIDGSGDLAFERLDEETITKVFFVGYQTSDVKITTNYDAVRNKIEVHRQAESGSSKAGWTLAAWAQDLTSQAKHGIKLETIKVPGYWASGECQLIADSILSQKRNPKYSAEIGDLSLESRTDYLDYGNYKIVFPTDAYTEIVNDCEDSQEWTVSNSGDIEITNSTTDLVDGAASLVIDFSISSGDIFQNVVSGNVTGALQSLRFFGKSSRVGSLLTVGVGHSSWNENTWPVDFVLLNEYQPFRFDLTGVSGDVNLIGFQLREAAGSTVGATTIHLDKIEADLKGHRHYECIYDSATYTIGPQANKIKFKLGPKPPEVENHLSALLSAAQDAKQSTQIR